MSYPSYKEIEVPLLKVLREKGGSAGPQDVYPAVAEYFSTLTDEELSDPQPSNPCDKKWWNMVRWTRDHLVKRGQIDGSERNIWKITQKGLARLQNGNISDIDFEKEPLPLRDLFIKILDEYQNQWERDNKGSNPFFREVIDEGNEIFEPLLNRYELETNLEGAYLSAISKLA